MENKKKKNIWWNLLFFLVLIGLTLGIILKDQTIFEILEIIKNVKLEYIFIGILCMIVYIFLEAINIGRTLKALGEKSTIVRNFKYAFIGFFFSSITPAASGGQPMQVYYMHKEKISVANSTLALLINLTSMQVITISIAIISLIFNYTYLNQILIICFIIGILLNASALALLVIAVNSKKLSRGIINFVIKILKTFKIRNIEDKQEILEKELEKYQYSAEYIKKNKMLMLKTILTTGIQFIIYYSIAYWTYKALGFSQCNIVEIITMQSVLFATVSGIPSPGAVGVSEGAFVEIFRNVYPNEMIKSATLLNRGINFYLFVIISGIIVLINGLRYKDEKSLEE